jgi:general secretion pathway protein D
LKNLTSDDSANRFLLNFTEKNMKLKAVLRCSIVFLIIFCLFTAPTATFAFDKKGEKNYKQGLKYEAAEQWDKAAEEFALAVAARPGNAEYLLHYRRALFNASQMMMRRGEVFAEQKNYVAAYNAFRQAYGYDPTNELAKSEMDRMLRLQKDAVDANDPNKPKESPAAAPSGVKLTPTAYNAPPQIPFSQQDNPALEQLREIKYVKQDLKTVIKQLAADLDLNVLFDKETFRPGSQMDLTIELHNVTTAQALDAIFLQESLFFQKVGKRMILVASQNRRQNFQQLVLRTFYLANAKPSDVQKVLQSAIPPQPGRPPSTAIVDEATNSITVRDTSENIKIIANLIKALDKDRAEVVMDVNIYEVSKNDLLQIGNQIGDQNSLISLGGTTRGALGIGRNGDIVGRDVTAGVRNAIATGFILPASNLIAFQSKDNTKLLASTQIHAFNNEDSEARIGQRVPVQTAQVYGGFTGTGTGGGQIGGVGSVFGSNGYPVINYEQVGLTLKFKPVIYPNQDVQVTMSIESKDVSSGGLTPTFTERSIKGTARIQNNRTLMLASVAQDNQSNGRQGLPVLGLIPILGRLFTAPKRDNRQVDIVIAVTPRVLRAPAILPEDEIERETGSIAVPTNSSLAVMVRQEDEEDRIAAARRLPTTAVVQLPDQQPETSAPGYVPAKNQIAENTAASASSPAITPKLIDASVSKALNLTQTAEKVNEEKPPLTNAAPTATELKIEPLVAIKAGEKRRVAIIVNSPAALRTAFLSLNYDAAKIKINRVVYGEVFGAELAKKDVPQFAANNGAMMANFPLKPNQFAQNTGVLAYVEIEALEDADNPFLQINSAASTVQ